MLRRLLAPACAAILIPVAGAASSTFYLDLKPGQCSKPAASKRYQVVPCANATHQFETYAVVHGGWGKGTRPSRATIYATADRLCNSAFVRRYGGRIRSGYGWEAFWPDPGAEAAKYADNIVCSLMRYPGHPAMGAGTHFRQAALG